MVNPIRKAFNWLVRPLGLKLASTSEIEKTVNRFMRLFGRRSPAYAGTAEAGIVGHEWNYVYLYSFWNNFDVTRKIGEAINREFWKHGGGVKPLFKKKCTACGHEYQEGAMDECEECGAPEENLRDPDPEQRKTLEAFIADPNRDDEWGGIVSSLLNFCLPLDDWYLSVKRSQSIIKALDPGGEDLVTSVLQVHVEDSRYVHIVADEHGNLGNGEYFCPDCPDNAQNTKSLDEYRKLGGRCPRCGGDLQETAYVWCESKGSEVKARWSRDEMIHRCPHPQLPHLYGNSPLVSGLRAAHIIKWMDAHNLENYSSGKVSKLVIIPGISQDEANQMHEDLASQVEDSGRVSPATGQRGTPRLYTPFIGIPDPKRGQPVAIDAMPDPEKMRQLELVDKYIERICALYGVTPTFKAVAEAGRAGVLERIDVDDDIVRGLHMMFQDAWRENLWPRLGVTDWEWAFNPIENRDELLRARINNMNVDTAIKAVNAGMDARIMEDGTLKVSGVPQRGLAESPEGQSAMPLTYPEEQAMRVQAKGATYLIKKLGDDA